MNKKPSKLAIHRETLRRLDDTAIASARGAGWLNTVFTCKSVHLGCDTVLDSICESFVICRTEDSNCNVCSFQ